MQPRRPRHNGDGYNRPNEGPPLSARWNWPTYYAAPIGALVVQSEQAAPNAQFADAHLIDDGITSGAISIALQIDVTSGENEVDLITNPGPAFSGYSFLVNSGASSVRIDRYDATVRTNLGTAGVPSVPNGFWIGGTRTPSGTLTLWTRQSSSDPWVSRLTATDLTYQSGMHLATYMDGTPGLTGRFGSVYISRAERRHRGRGRLYGITPPI